MSDKLIDQIHSEFKDKLPINVFFVEGKENEPIKNVDLAFVSSDFHQTQKMRCNSFYKPAFL